MRWPAETIGFAGPLKRLRHGDEICRPAEKIAACDEIRWPAEKIAARRPAEKVAARRWDLPAR